MNVDPLYSENAPPTEVLLAHGCYSVRLVSRDTPEVLSYVSACQAAGILVLAILTEESHGFWCPADMYQIGNRPDLQGMLGPYTAGSDYMGAQAYVDYWTMYFNTMRDQGVTAPIIGAGLELGDPGYWKAVQTAGGLPGAAGFAVHPYVKTAPQAKALLASYQRITPNLPLYVTEWNRPRAEILPFAAMLRSSAIWAWWYTWGREAAIGQGMTRKVHPLDGTASRILQACR
jgi:hypothetical protein